MPEERYLGFRVSGVAVVFALSVASIALADVVLARTISLSAFGAYQLVRFGAPLVAIVALAGLDQAIPRAYAGAAQPRWTRPLLRATARSLVLGGVMGFGLMMVTESDPIMAVGTSLAAAGLTSSNLGASSMRAMGRYTSAAVAQQGHRVMFGAAALSLLAVGTTSGTSVLVAFVSSTLILGIWGVVRARTQWKRVCPTKANMGELRRIGRPIMVAVLTLGAMDWVDQAVLAASAGSLAVSGAYAAAKAYIVFPFVALAAVMGFVLVPELVRRGIDSAAQSAGGVIRRLLVFCITLVAAACTIIALVPKILPVALSWTEIGVLLLVGAARLFMVLPSSVMGAFASPRYLRIFAGASVAALVIEAVIVAALSSIGATGAAIGLCVAVVIRVSVGMSISLRTLRVPSAT